MFANFGEKIAHLYFPEYDFAFIQIINTVCMDFQVRVNSESKYYK